MPYLVTAAEVTVPRQIGTLLDSQGREFPDNEAVGYINGDVIADDDVSPAVRQKVEDGDPFTSKQLRYITDEEAAQRRGQASEDRDDGFSHTGQRALTQTPDGVEVDPAATGSTTTSPVIGEGPEKATPAHPADLPPAPDTHAAAREASGGGGGGTTADPGPSLSPAEVTSKSVEDARTYMRAHPDEVDAIKAYEESHENRKGIVNFEA